MQVNTEGGLQGKKRRMYRTVEMALDQGVDLTLYCTERLHPTPFSFCHFSSSFIAKKATHR